MTNFYIIVGSVMGTAQGVSEALATQLRDQGYSVELNQNYQQGDLATHTKDIILLCTSNTGMGDLPQNIAPLLSELQNAPPALYGSHYALINLGDSSYPNFAQAGRTLDEAFADLGAQRLGEAFIIDAIETEDAKGAALSWLTMWLNQYHTQLTEGNI